MARSRYFRSEKTAGIQARRVLIRSLRWLSTACYSHFTKLLVE